MFTLQSIPLKHKKKRRTAAEGLPKGVSWGEKGDNLSKARRKNIGYSECLRSP